MNAIFGKHKGGIPFGTIIGVVVVILVVAIVAAVAIPIFTGVRDICYSVAGKDFNICRHISFSASGQEVVQYYREDSQLPVSPEGDALGAPSNGEPTPPAGRIGLSVETITVQLQDPLSKSWTAHSGTFKIFQKGVNIRNPDATPLQSGALSSGKKIFYNVVGINTNTEWQLVNDGGGTYYDTYIKSYVFDPNRYNSKTGNYSLLLGLNTIYSNEVGRKIGTISVTIANTSGEAGMCFNKYTVNTSIPCDTTQTRTIEFNATAADGTFDFDVTLKNTGSNALLKNMVMQSVNDLTNPVEGNEFTTVKFQHLQGTDLFAAGGNIDNDLTSELSNNFAVPLSSWFGGTTGKATLTFTMATANIADNETFYLYFDDLGSYNGKDALTSNAGASNVAIKFRLRV